VLIVRRVEALGKIPRYRRGRNLLAGLQAAGHKHPDRGEEGPRDYSASPTRQSIGRRGMGSWRRRHRCRPLRKQGARSPTRIRCRHVGDGELRPHVDAFFDKVTSMSMDSPCARTGCGC